MQVDAGLDGNVSHCPLGRGKSFANLHTSSVGGLGPWTWQANFGNEAGDAEQWIQGLPQVPKSQESLLARTPPEPILPSIIAQPKDIWV